MNSGAVAAFIQRAAADPVKLTIRELLAVWEFRFRNYDSVARVTADLSAAGLQCTPDLGEGGLGAEVRIGPVQESALPGSDAANDSPAEQDQPLELPSFTLRMGDIPSATAGVLPVNPSQSLAEAQYLMVLHDYSQLPVMSGSRTLKGVVSWRSIASKGLANPDLTLADAIDPYPKVVYATQDLLDQVQTVYDAGFVLVRGADQSITGIVTTADLASQFRDLATPFFQLGDIESKLRRCISVRFSLQDIRSAVRKPNLESVSKMTFGEYIMLLQDPDRWEQMHWPQVPRNLFIRSLDEVRLIRNRVMHFGLQLEMADRIKLTAFLKIMGPLDPHH